MSEHTTAVTIPAILLDTVAGVQERLLSMQTALALALGVLGKATTYGDAVVLEGVSDIFAALTSVLANACAEPAPGVNTTGVFNATERENVAGNDVTCSGKPRGPDARRSWLRGVRRQQTRVSAS